MMTAAELRARGGHQLLTPVVRRWRCVSPLGPRRKKPTAKTLLWRTGRSGSEGIPGRRHVRSDKRHVIATLKHFAAHGQPESGTNLPAGEYLGANAARDVLSTFRRRSRAAR